VLGTLIIINGWPKLINLEQTPGYINMMGLPVEMELLFGLLELGHRWLVLNNRLLSRIVSLLFAIVMILPL
jgi:hypothetical protein